MRAGAPRTDPSGMRLSCFIGPGGSGVSSRGIFFPKGQMGASVSD